MGMSLRNLLPLHLRVYAFAMDMLFVLGYLLRPLVGRFLLPKWNLCFAYTR